MGRAPCCDKSSVKKGPWSPEEDDKLKDYIHNHGTGGNWIALPHKIGLKRCGKSCRLRWLNYLRPNIKHGDFSDDEDRKICALFATIGSRWSIIAAQLPGRTDNDIKNYWNTKLKKKLFGNMMPKPQKILHQELGGSCSFPLSVDDGSLCLQNPSFPSPYPYGYSSPNFQTLFSPNCDWVFGNPNFSRVGGEPPSCSSPDGSCISMNNQVGYSNADHNHTDNLCGFADGGILDHRLLSSGGGDDFGGGIQTPFDDSIEEIKQLITMDEIKAEFD